MIDFRTSPEQYKHWKLSFDGNVATLAMDVDEDGGLVPGYQLKLNSYDLSVDIELFDAIQRLRFEHPEVGAVVMTSAKDNIFCAGANIKMLGASSHAHKVNFCKFTNETRNSIEDASDNSHQRYITAVNGPCAGGGYELALATDYIVMADDGNTSVSLPEVPLLAVLPGTGGLTRVVDKRMVRRDRADFFCTIEEGIKGQRAVDWKLIDEVVPKSKLADHVAGFAAAEAGKSDRPAGAKGVAMTPFNRTIEGDSIKYDLVDIQIDRENRSAHILVKAPAEASPQDAAGILVQGADFWPFKMARELDDAMLHLRANEAEIGTWVLRTEGSSENVASADAALAANADDWFVREVTLFLKRTMKRLDLSARTLMAMIEPASCFTGTLLELALTTDRSFMLDGQFEGDNRPAAVLQMTAANFGPYPMSNGLTRLESRFLGEEGKVAELEALIATDIDTEQADDLGLVTFIPDDIDWEDEIRMALEERARFSPDALTGMEANLRFVGPETMETKIFARLSAWQNWIFQRPNAVGEKGALSLFGSGQRAELNKGRV
ncbi:MAG: 2,3-epoxybenzoyl-CoA dihydrolase [Alphaproteobacteria bacterium]|jgi:benzoyl-CoA-dihydrodiol lyase|nr:2,3-epoxybenzoyl-CoA dihydrolase [Alphaproteobacteria bacterium]MBT4964989.1 2,3-epoxybenzoyl-CoA dihydrolase [Alphaproteobacteria bacterium]MBT5161234.1 2,3-epoxybenzoyl-CoA dihydrolase [Alphaproteobacteria bacterium]MBT5918566.1 2,3-epoxybenzoyl-CoA dihydrolase [Alphaproteobacteria bacterium]MBT6386312.1 2,3-epoxybenzoyl-CoA dihydrolase [Alphaproteobacteria bacterium]